MQPRKYKGLYLAYGSNLHLGQMHQRCPEAVCIGTTMLPDTRLIFRGSGSGYYLSIEAEKGKQTPCAVFRITDRDEKFLDLYEGYPRFYRKVYFSELPLFDRNGEEQPGKIYAMAYTLNPTCPAGFPSKEYLKTCLHGYGLFGFDDNYLKEAMITTWQTK